MSVSSDRRPAERARDKLSLLRNHPLFADLPSTVIEHLGSYMKTRRVAKGATIFAKGDPGTGLMGVLTGQVKVSVASADGRDIVLNIFHEGEIFGEIALLDGQPRTADATAMSNCELIVIERRDFVPFLSDHPDVTIKFIEILCARLRRTSEQVQDVTFLNLPARLAKTLLLLTADTEASATRRKVAITQREISQIIGRSRESTNKQLREWAKRGWVRLERGGVSVLAPDRLASVAAEGSASPEFPGHALRRRFHDALGCEQLRELSACVEHPSLDGVAGNSEDLRNLLHRFFVVVDEIDDLPMLPGKLLHASPQDFPAMLVLEQDFRIIRRIADVRALVVDRLLGPMSQLGERLVTRDGQNPSGDRRARLEPVRLTPHAEERLAGDIFRDRIIADDPQYETIDPDMVPCEQDLHREPVAGRDLLDQCLIRMFPPSGPRSVD